MWQRWKPVLLLGCDARPTDLTVQNVVLLNSMQALILYKTCSIKASSLSLCDPQMHGQHKQNKDSVCFICCFIFAQVLHSFLPFGTPTLWAKCCLVIFLLVFGVFLFSSLKHFIFNALNIYFFFLLFFNLDHGQGITTATVMHRAWSHTLSMFKQRIVFKSKNSFWLSVLVRTTLMLLLNMQK